MADRLSPDRRSWNMSRIRSANTSLEIRVRKYLFSQGLRYTLNSKLQGRPDLIFQGPKVAVFINGCFWHFHGCKLSSVPKTRQNFWKKKLENNRLRDATVKSSLECEGWKVVTIWECEVENDLRKAVKPLTDILKKSRTRHIPKHHP